MNVSRIQHIQTALKSQNLDFGFIQGKSNLFYLTGFRCEPHERLVALIIPADGAPVVIAPNMELNLIKEVGWQSEIIGYSDTDNPWSLIHTYLKSNQIGTERIGIEASILTYQRALALQELEEQNNELIDFEEVLLQTRLIKSQEERAILQEAAKLADFGVEVGVQAIKKGATELALIATIEYELKQKGIREMSFDTLVLTGANSANPHGKPGLNAVQPGDFVLFDLGVVYEGYCSDITRTVAFQSVSEKQHEIYETVLSAQLAAIEASKIGNTLGSIDQAARTTIEEKGYGSYFPHRIGHGLGTDVHEWPSLNATNSMLLKPGMCYTIEPGIYVPNIGGVRIEDDMFIDQTGPTCLTQFPKELQIIK
ncbi:M24 family metallopeptidase [Alkalihalobacillus pseudalcaliphilus]|uniref:M24 family metallopeptidase n=1 Tax=Alkalihalobacillus pseudalcaliphilus TaxID=79884 RepID=UPI00064DA289|nr:Xaa-Pro peptidase family protein [Alkalihalobacillus pseudalcaliphilus]KMK74543.1 metallopeptidase [Alkalihalobacillus pseudalcaliphilus]